MSATDRLPSENMRNIATSYSRAPQRLLALALFISPLAHGGEQPELPVKTPHGDLLLRIISLPHEQPERPCGFSARVGNTSAIEWLNTTLSVTVTGYDYQDRSMSLAIALHADRIGKGSNAAVNLTAICKGDRFIQEVRDIRAVFVSGTPDPEAIRLTTLPIVDAHPNPLFVAADRKCAMQFQQSLKLDGLDLRKAMAELVAYSCGFIVPSAVRATQENSDSGFALITISEGSFKNRAGWVPLLWIRRPATAF